jgi:hypothetical protein
MAISFYDVSVGSYLQTLDAARGFLQKSLDWSRDKGLDAETLLETSLIADMRPLRFQVHQIVFHSAGAIEAMRNGVLEFGAPRPGHTYAELQAEVGKAADALRGLSVAEVNALEGKDVAFRVPGKDDRVFTAEGFVLTFSLPNLHFHAATAYDILRAQGAPVGKLDFMGALRLKK